MPKEKTPSSQDREKKNKRKREKREYYRRNKEEINAKNREHNLKNRERYKKYRKTYKDKINAKNREYYLKNKDKINAKNREYYLKNKDKINATTKKYREQNKEKTLELNIKQRNQKRIKSLLELIAAGKSEEAAVTIRKMRNFKYLERNLKEIEAALQKHYQEKGEEVPRSISDAVKAKREGKTAPKRKQTDISDAGNDILPSSIEAREQTPSYVPSPSESESNSDCPPYPPSKRQRGDSGNGSASDIADNAEAILSLLSMSTNLPDYFSKKMPSTPNQSLGTLDGLVDLPDDLIQALSRLPDSAESTPEPQLSEHLPTQQVYATFTEQIPVVTGHSPFQPFYGGGGITPISQQPTAPAIAGNAEEILSLLSMSTNLLDYFSKKMPSTPNQSLGTLDGLVDLPDDFIKALSRPSASPASTQAPQLSEHLPAQRVYAPFTEQPPVVTGHSLFQPLFYGGGGQMQNQQPREPRVPTSAQPRYAVPPQQPVARQPSWQDRLVGQQPFAPAAPTLPYHHAVPPQAPAPAPAPFPAPAAPQAIDWQAQVPGKPSWQDRVTSRPQQPSTTDRPAPPPFQGGFRLF